MSSPVAVESWSFRSVNILTVSFPALRNDKTGYSWYRLPQKMSADDFSPDSSDAVAWYDERSSRDRSNIDSWLQPPYARIVGRATEKVVSATVTISGRKGIDSSVCFRRSDFRGLDSRQSTCLPF